MTTDASADQAEYLSTLLLEEKGFTTYRTAARALKVHPDTAKQLLYDFYDRNRDHLSASFVTTGRTENGVLVRLSSEKDLQSVIVDFAIVHTSHVYSLVSKKATVSNFDVSLLELNNPVDHANLDWHHKNGLIRGPELRAGAKAASRAPPSNTTSTKSPAGVSYTPRKQAEKEDNTPKAPAPAAKPKSDLSSRYVSRKAEKKETQAKKSDQKPAFQYKSRKNEPPKVKERVVISENAHDDEMETDEPAVPKATSSELQNLFLDNLSDFSDDDKPIDKDEPVIVPDNDEDAAEELETKPATSEEASEPSRSILTQLPTKSSEQPEPEEALPPQENTVDEDGYITSFSKRPGPAEPRKAEKKQRTVPEPKQSDQNKPKDGKKKQTSLMNFFQKR